MAQSIEITGKSITDTIRRKSALNKIQQHASTEALECMAEMSVKPNASEKLVKNYPMLKKFL